MVNKVRISKNSTKATSAPLPTRISANHAVVDYLARCWSSYNLICVGLGPIINDSHKRALKNHFIEVGGRYRIFTVHGAEL